jgi:integrase
LGPLAQKQLDVYEVLDEFISYIQKHNPKLTSVSIRLYLASVRSYFGYFDIDVIPAKFRRKCKMPTIIHEDEYPIDAKDIRQIIITCNNRRLKSYLHILASCGCRAVEALAIRLCDIDNTVQPTKIRIRAEYSKGKHSREIYISSEAQFHLQQWLEFKYRDRSKEGKNIVNRERHQEDLVFATRDNVRNPNNLYKKILREFEQLLDAVEGLNGRKEDGVYNRRRTTFHSFRRHLFGVLSDLVSSDYANYYLGHTVKSVYYTYRKHLPIWMSQQRRCN